MSVKGEISQGGSTRIISTTSLVSLPNVLFPSMAVTMSPVSGQLLLGEGEILAPSPGESFLDREAADPGAIWTSRWNPDGSS
eukprot:756475-Hanusia_phi.AAC.4